MRFILLLTIDTMLTDGVSLKTNTQPNGIYAILSLARESLIFTQSSCYSGYSITLISKCFEYISYPTNTSNVQQHLYTGGVVFVCCLLGTGGYVLLVFVCLFVSTITQKVMNRLPCNFIKGSRVVKEVMLKF